MALQEKLATDLKEAMRKGDATRRSTIRLAMAAIHNAEIAQGRPLADGDVFGVLAKEVKQRRDSIVEFAKGNRQDLVAKEEAELNVLLEYLPQQMSREEVVLAARKVMGEVGARGPGDKGKVMKELMAQIKGRVDGQVVNTVVSELLSGREA
ncbi:MAG: GatB/YqeY domain-containing protein [Chloroflexi bacterium]|nr:GatB/YqeY domain-containing protein [Chloroflexota bacterium]